VPYRLKECTLRVLYRLEERILRAPYRLKECTLRALYRLKERTGYSNGRGIQMERKWNACANNGGVLPLSRPLSAIT
jgi:hypothetical protein